MKAPKGYRVTTSTVAAMEKEAEQVKRLQAQMKQAMRKLYALHDGISWTNYLGSEEQSTLTEDELTRLYRAQNIVCTATDWDR